MPSRSAPRSDRFPTVAVVGATGAVGREMISILEERAWSPPRLRFFSSARSAGQTLPFRGHPVVIEEFGEHSLDGVDLALFSAGSSVSKKFAPAAAAGGTLVVDNSSAFRMTAGVPLVVPEINAAELRSLGRGGIVANPNCSTIIMLVPLNPIRGGFGIERIVVSTYQAASGAGAAGMQELLDQTRGRVEGRTVAPSVFHEPYAFNLFSHNTGVDPHTGRNVEEQKMIDETRKIWGDPAVAVVPTCIRVPVLRAHAESITVTLKKAATLRDVRAALDGAPGVELVDDRAGNRFPTPHKASGRDPVLVGRLRPDDTQGWDGAGEARRYRGFSLFVCGDQLRKGAALNAVQIAEMMP